MRHQALKCADAALGSAEVGKGFRQYAGIVLLKSMLLKRVADIAQLFARAFQLASSVHKLPSDYSWIQF